MAKIFISYRRDDSQSIVDRIYDNLYKNYREGEIFKDVLSISPGDNFINVIDDQISKSEVVLLIIGKNWIKTLKNREGGEDILRNEIISSLNQNRKIIPIYVEGAKPLKPEELPLELRSLAYLHNLEVRPDPDFKNDISQLIFAINKNLLTKSIYKPEKKNKKINLLGILIGFLLTITALALYIFTNNDKLVEERCDYTKKAILIANFMKGQQDGFSNSLMTNLDNALSDSIYDVRPVGDQARDIKNYSDTIKTKYFSSKCQPSGMFINGFLEPSQKVFNLYANLVNLKINNPIISSDNTVFLHNPSSLEFSIKEDAKFVADFILSIIDIYENNEKRALKKLSELEQDQNNKDDAFKSTVAFYKGQCYALRGDEKRARIEYQKVATSDKPELVEAARKNELVADKISEVYQADPKNASLRKRNITEHSIIEENIMKLFGKGVEEIGRKIEKNLNKMFK